MKKSNVFKKSGILFYVCAFIICMTHIAYGVGPSQTLSGTIIGNRATVNYTVNAIPQNPIGSSPAGNSSGAGSDTTFVVDNKVDLTVATQDGTIVQVTPGASSQVLTYLVTNTGNTVQDYSLSATNSATGAFSQTETFDASNVIVRVESSVHSGYQSGEDTALFIDELGPDANSIVYIVADIPIGQVNNDIASYDLTAQTAQGNTSGQGADITSDDSAVTDNPATVQIVFADSAGTTDSLYDGKHSSKDGYKCVSAVLTITKTSTVISDPINGATNPKRIPGAVIEYMITVSNASGVATADNIEVTDSLNTEITASTIAFLSDGYDTGKGIQIEAPNINGGSPKNLTNSKGSPPDDEGDFNGTTTNTVTVTGISLSGGQNAYVRFRVEVL